MTANELADEVMEHYKSEAPRGFNVNWMKEVATILRQQAKEIGMLKQIIDANNLQSDIGQFIKPIDEQFKEGFEAGKEEGWKAHKFHHPTDTIPYKDLHQVVKNVLAQPMRELTDEEINKVFEEIYSESIVPATRKSFDFARAILKKASEK